MLFNKENSQECMAWQPIKTTVDSSFTVTDIISKAKKEMEKTIKEETGIDISKGKITIPLPEHYIINENACILFWKNGEKTVVKKCADDTFNPRLAFLTAFFQHYINFSKSKANKYLASLQVEVKEVKPKQKPKHMKEEKKLKFKVGDELINNDGEKVTILKIDNKETVLSYLAKDTDGYELWYSENQLRRKNR